MLAELASGALGTWQQGALRVVAGARAVPTPDAVKALDACWPWQEHDDARARARW